MMDSREDAEDNRQSYCSPGPRLVASEPPTSHPSPDIKYRVRWGIGSFYSESPIRDWRLFYSQSPKADFTQVDDKLPAQANHDEAKDHNQLPQLVTINPEVKALHKLITLNQEEPGTSSNLITKPNPGVVQLHETSIHS